MQQALFGHGAPAFDGKLTGIRRLELSGGAWIEHHPSWLSGHERVFRELEQTVAWQHQRRWMYEREVDVPRLVAKAPVAGELGRLLLRLSARLAQRYQRSFENISLAYYRDGRDSVALHGDKVGSLANDCIIATVSVGAPRRFLLKPNAGSARRGVFAEAAVAAEAAAAAEARAVSAQAKAAPAASAGGTSGGRSLAFDLGWGDLFVMGGTCQRTWQHAIPKRAHADPRISIMFRPPIPQSTLRLVER